MLKPLITAEELAPRVGLPSAKIIHNLRRRRKIPATVLGHRTILFDEDAVRAALKKFEVKAV